MRTCFKSKDSYAKLMHFNIINNSISNSKLWYLEIFYTHNTILEYEKNHIR